MGSELACVENFDSDLVCARGFHLDLLDLEGLAWTPAHGGLALDHLSRSFGHDSGITRVILFDKRGGSTGRKRGAPLIFFTLLLFLFLQLHQAVVAVCGKKKTIGSVRTT